LEPPPAFSCQCELTIRVLEDKGLFLKVSDMGNRRAIPFLREVRCWRKGLVEGQRELV
jgi:hypothetical protein